MTPTIKNLDIKCFKCQGNGEIVTKDDKEENEMPPLKDVEDEEYTALGN